jgi:hypothetical protein
MSQLDRGLCLSPQWLRGHKAIEIKRLFPREHVIHGSTQLMGERGQGLALPCLCSSLAK